MQYKKIELGSYNLHMIKTDRFKTVNVQIILSDKIKKEDITKRNFLSDMLTYSSLKYPTKKDISMASQDLYAANIYSTSYRLGNYYNTDINLYFLNEKYSEEGMTEKSIEFLSEIIFNPNVTNNKFDSSSFNVIKNNMRIQIESVKEDTRKYSMIKMLENMGKDQPYSYHGFGYLDDLEKITEENLYEYYKEFIKSSSVEIFVIGNIDFDFIEKIIREKFKFNVYKKKKENPTIIHENIRSRAKTIIEEDDINQSKLTIGCKVNGLTDFEKHYVLTLYNIILGGGSESLLFQNVREKNSLCYYVNSSSNKVDNLIIISSGITKKNFKKTVSLIKKEISNIEKGNFSDEIIEQAKIRYKSVIDEIYDYPNQIISSYYASEILGVDFPDIRKKKIMEVTKEDIMKISKKIKIDTIYLLGGKD
ncbi:MAG: insulinase family protein [Bacilli bacterium]|nr:insulinase family protein [Bacilli bacterium]